MFKADPRSQWERALDNVREHASQQREAASALRQDALKAREVGVPVSAISEAARVSAQEVYAWLAEEASDVRGTERDRQVVARALRLVAGLVDDPTQAEQLRLWADSPNIDIQLRGFVNAQKWMPRRYLRAMTDGIKSIMDAAHAVHRDWVAQARTPVAVPRMKEAPSTR